MWIFPDFDDWETKVHGDEESEVQKPGHVEKDGCEEEEGSADSSPGYETESLDVKGTVLVRDCC